MGTRTRTRDYEPKDCKYVFNGVPTTTTRVQGHDYCLDVIGSRGQDHALSLQHSHTDGCEMDWTSGTSHGVGPAFNYNAPKWSLDTSARAGWASQFTAQKIAAATVPEKPSVYNYTNLLELRDVPQMLRHAGDLLHHLRHAPILLTKPKMIASTTLAWQFGWGPLVQDILKMCDFGKAVDQRLKTLRTLRSGHVVHRKVKFGTYTTSRSGYLTYHSAYGIGFGGQTSTVEVATVWGTIRWRLADPGQLGRVPTWLEAFNQLYGLTAREVPVQIWKALPWTWMTDWFANISEALEVSGNLLTYSPSNCCKMTQLVTTTTYAQLHPQPNQRFDGGSNVITSKSREVFGIGDITGVHLHVPFIDTYKLSVLSSLTVLKLLHGRG